LYFRWTEKGKSGQLAAAPVANAIGACHALNVCHAHQRFSIRQWACKQGQYGDYKNT